MGSLAERLICKSVKASRSIVVPMSRSRRMLSSYVQEFLNSLDIMFNSSGGLQFEQSYAACVDFPFKILTYSSLKDHVRVPTSLFKQHSILSVVHVDVTTLTNNLKSLIKFTLCYVQLHHL